MQTLGASSAELSTFSSGRQRRLRRWATVVERTGTVSAAAEESSANTVSVAASMEQAATNLQSVAGATEEMSATVADIAANSERARAISEQGHGGKPRPFRR